MLKSRVRRLSNCCVLISDLRNSYWLPAGGIEPFDEGLDRHIWFLSDQSLQWDGEIATKRRTEPQEVRRLVKELIVTQQEVDDEERAAYAAADVTEGEMGLNDADCTSVLPSLRDMDDP